MKKYVSTIIPKIERLSQTQNTTTLLANQRWVIFDEASKCKTVCIFRNGGELLISVNGNIERAKWEHLGQNSLLVDTKDQSYLLHYDFFDQNLLALKVDSQEEYAVLINESRCHCEINSIAAVLDFLNKTYYSHLSIPARNAQQHTTYHVAHTKEGYSLRLGAYREYTITFSTGHKYSIYKKRANGKFFVYQDKEVVEFPDKSTCIEYIERMAG